MGLSFRILDRHGLVFVRQEGFARTTEALAALRTFAALPGAAEIRKHLIDLGPMTGHDGDYVTLLRMQAEGLKLAMGGEGEVILVYHAPTPQARRLVAQIRRSWDDFPLARIVAVESEEQALEILGLPSRSFDELMAEAVRHAQK